ncbi:1-phosphofructokinase family hexose kinase [Paragemmobacter straminiformis]|uniref:Phosphofructokinase n=1 Tax=Paragemmobacter straminiformis TaxID=2045119 RepID=A0A842I2G4_9RHOB|nr:1-phosphofructokinase family hexose kinase [Gemmobacter straminiformis]MBC2834150.1 1-phosphofructokinase family hexose kinase [Gemmobacter straminiformis]
MATGEKGGFRQQAPILTLTLNPALDMATEVAVMRPDEKLRCSDPQLDPGGGGLNVSRAVHLLGGESLALVALGGLTGDRLAELIRREGVMFLGITGPGETRQSLTVNEAATGRQYRFMLPGPVWHDEDQERVFMLLRAAGKPGGFSVISGSQPPGVPVDFPARLASAMAGMRVVMDTSGAALTRAVEHPVPGLEVLRMDGEEAEALAGRALATRADTADFAGELVARGVARKVIVARGSDGSVLAGEGLRIFAKAPKVAVRSKVGAGDSFVGGYVLTLAQGGTEAEALAKGVAAAAAAVMSAATELCRAEDVDRLLPEARVETV